MLSFGMGHAGAYGEPPVAFQTLAVLLIAWPFWTFFAVLDGWVYHREQKVGRAWFMSLLAIAAEFFTVGLCIYIWRELNP